MSGAAGSPTALLRRDELPGLLAVPFTDEQLDAITAPLEPALVVAGAGSGKTTVMAARVVWLVGTRRVRPDQVLGLTFTNKAAGELANRVHQALARLAGDPTDERDGEPTVSTYHAYAGRLLREHGLRLGLEPDARLLTDATRYQLAQRAVARYPGPVDVSQARVPDIVAKVVALDDELGEHLVDPEQVLRFDAAVREAVAQAAARGRVTNPVREVADRASERDELLALVAHLRDEKRRRGVVDFADVLASAARIAEQVPLAGAIERDRFRVVLLDEYQDTSVAQKRMLLALFGGGHPVTAVGDPFQAIYGWRGASVSNIEQFPDEFRRGPGERAPAATLYSLSTNLRSGGRLLALANRLAQPLRQQHPAVRPLVPLAAVSDRGDCVVGRFDRYDDEIGWVADDIARRIAEGAEPRSLAVLVRTTPVDVPAVYEALSDRGVPVEVVGLSGLLAVPEVADLVATLRVLDQPTENAALVRLLTGPRWRIGPRDLVLLGRRAMHLLQAAGDPGPVAEQPYPAAHGVGAPLDDGAAEGGDDLEPLDRVRRALRDAVAGTDPAEVVSLLDAVEDPGRLPYSAAARARFAELAAELRLLRRHVGDPLLDVLHLVVSTTGLDVEVAASRRARRTGRADALAAFLEHACAFADLDGDPSIGAFLAYLGAAEQYDSGLDLAAVGSSDSVKLMTVHKAKGLEWDVVYLPDVVGTVFPSAKGRPRWTRAPEVLPFPLRGDASSFPEVTEWSTKGLQAFAERLTELNATEELRLAYVAVTRARHTLVMTGHWWGRTQKRPRVPSGYLDTAYRHARAGGDVVCWAQQPSDDATNPTLDHDASRAWPRPLEPSALQRRTDAAATVRRHLERLASREVAADELLASAPPPPDEADRVRRWDLDLRLLLDEARSGRRPVRDVPLPASLSATQLVRLGADPQGLARDLARPLPRPPAPAARRGTRFHAWVESLFDAPALLDLDDLAGAGDPQLLDADLEELQRAFLAGPYAARPPLAVEAPFQLELGGHAVRGRIDAVYARDDGGYQVVDWKTGAGAADPLQLAVYRLAWADLAGVAPQQVSAAFYYVRSGEVVEHVELPDRVALAGLLLGESR